MTPTDHGYVKCTRCGCWRPAHLLRVVLTDGHLPMTDVCKDDAVCSRLAGVGDAKIDVRGDAGGAS
jgi:hypothetical protein